MGTVYAELELANAGDLFMHRRGLLSEDKVKRMNIDAFVDSGSYMLIITEHVQQQLDLPFIEEQVFRMVDESEVRGQVFGPVEIRFENRRATADAVVIKGVTEVLLGSIPMEDLDVVIDPKRQRLIVNPESPHIATKILK